MFRDKNNITEGVESREDVLEGGGRSIIIRNRLRI